MILEKEKDPTGAALIDFLHNGKANKISVNYDNNQRDTLSPEYFFREHNKMPKLEQIALKKCSGRVLDVGAGAGCHSLYLQELGFDVVSLDISVLSCEVMKERGVKNVLNCDIFSFDIDEKFDTILLLMNGSGIAATLDGFSVLLQKCKKLINPNGKILLDSSDLIYLYEDEDGSFMIDLNQDKYYGEIDYQLKYKNIKSDSFSWLFIDQVNLSEIALQNGFVPIILEYGSHYDYLAQLTLK